MSIINAAQRTFAAAKVWLLGNGKSDGPTYAVCVTLCVVTIVAVYECHLLTLQARSFEENLRVLSGEWQELFDRNFGVDTKRGIRAIKKARAILRESRGASDGNQSGREKEQSSSCNMDTGGTQGIPEERDNDTHGVAERITQNMGLAQKKWRSIYGRTRGNGGRLYPRPYHENPVKLRPDGTVVPE